MWSFVERKRRASESFADSNEEVPSAKRRRTFSEGEKPWSLKHRQPVKQDIEPSTESAVTTDVKSESAAKTDDTPEQAKPEGKRVASGEHVHSRKDRKRKRSSVQSASEQETEETARMAKAARASDTGAEMSCHDADCKPSVNCGDEVKKQTHKSKLRKDKKCKNKQKTEPPRLRVISKLVDCMSSIIDLSYLHFVCIFHFSTFYTADSVAGVVVLLS